METLCAGATLTVSRLDRLGRSLGHLIETVEKLEAMGVGSQSLTESVHTAARCGKPVFGLLALVVLAEFERILTTAPR